jgi:CO/xanthine dehydrogenase Mo-binding subunit
MADLNKVMTDKATAESVMHSVNSPMRKKDSMALVTGKPVYTDDLAPEDCLVIKLLRSPYAHALIEDINTDIAKKVPGIEAVYTYKDVPDLRFTMAGQTYPEPSPYDRLILDKRLRYVGDPVAIVAGESEKAVEKALKLIKVKYEVLEPLLDFRAAKDNDILVHPEDNWKSLCPVGADNKRNLCASAVDEHGDLDKAFAESDVVMERTYHTQANQQAMMETFRAYAYMDIYDRLTIVSATQITFHVRRIVSNALGIPKSRIRVIKPRIGGGFGAKQTAIMEVYPAFVTLMTGKRSKLIFTREESQIASTPRHEMEVTVKIGATKDGIIKALDLYTLSNTGAYGEHGPTTVGLSGHKSLPLYSRAEAHRFAYDVVYTNVMSAGAYRGYGATQGIFAIESIIDELAHKLDIAPVKLRELNMTREGDLMPAYYGETANSCALDRCLARVKEMIDWDNKYPCRDMGNGKVRSVGLALAMQGSAISNCDVASVAVKVNDDGFYSLMIGASDMGTGCDTILAQMAADCMCCDTDNIVVYGVDTDTSPYDSGSYASSTTYLTGMAVIKTCTSLVDKIKHYGALLLKLDVSEVDFNGKEVYRVAGEEKISLKDIANSAMCNNNNALYASESHSSPVSPPPYMAGAVEIELDKETGKIEIINYKAVVDCGTVINPALARVQTEGGLAQGIGMAMYEDVNYTNKGVDRSNSFMQYKIPTRLDIGTVEVAFESSYEPTGPFGAKSIGEIVINTPSPAIANAVYNAVGVRIRDLPITAEKIYRGMKKNEA